MKAILLLTVLSLTFSASLGLDSTKFCSGMYNILNFTTTQIQDCIICLQSNATNNLTLRSQISPDNTMPDEKALGDAFLNTIFPKDQVTGASCKAFVRNLQKSLVGNMTSEEVQKSIEKNLKDHYLVVMMNYGAWRKDFLGGYDWEFGKQEARVLMYAIGTDNIYSIPDQEQPMPPIPSILDTLKNETKKGFLMF